MERRWALTTKRAINERTGTQLRHSQSRHLYTDDNLTHSDGNTFGQGSIFPDTVGAGELTSMEEYVQDQYWRWKHGQKSRIASAHEAGNALRLEVKINKFGIRKVGAFIRQDRVATVFPTETTRKKRGFLKKI